MPSRRRFLQTLGAAPAALAATAPRIRHVDIFHHSHTDVGFTDLPSVCREMQVRFLGAALDACLHDKRFRWTAEAMVTVDDWWRAASRERREDLLKVVRSGQMDIMALPFNQAPFMDAVQWKQALAWIPDSLWKQLNPRAAMQNDVNGFPRAGAMLLLDRGIRHLLMGINADSGGPPFRRPTAFWWKMPDGRRMFVWLGDHYGVAYGFFEERRFIRGQPKGADVAMRAPRAGDHLRTGEPSLRAAHANFTKRLQKLESEGYALDRLILSYTNQWRYDNDPPFPPLADFVEAWNRLGLQPPLRLTTATQAVLDMETAAGGAIPVREGEWTDWWANGDASGPREVAASRVAKRQLAASVSPVWGEMTPSGKRKVEEILKDLCLFDEHTWGANISISRPDSLDTIGQYTEKSLLAYRPMGHAEWLLGQRARTKLDSLPEGLHVTNTTKAPFTGWVSFPDMALRDDSHSVDDVKTGRSHPIFRTKGGSSARIWVENLAPETTLAMRLAKREVEVEAAPAGAKPAVEADAGGWPSAVTWPGMKRPLFLAGTGNFLAVVLIPPANRSTITRIHATPDAAKREEMRRAALKFVPAGAGTAQLAETPHTLVCTQPLEHPRLANATRRLELWKREPRARLNVRFDRISSTAPELFYIEFAFPAEGVMPTLSNGGMPFVPYRDQLEGSTRDYYAIDGWAQYASPEGAWLWVSRDAPLVAVGGPHPIARRTAEPPDPHRLFAMVFDNCWHTNFVANSHGEMEFQFELLWRQRPDRPEDTAAVLVSEPVVVINPSMKESPELMRNLYLP